MTTLEERPTSSETPAAPPLPQRAQSTTRGWYRDPAGCHEFRYWDGLRWTPGVADNGFVREDPLPDRPCAPPTDPRVRPPLRAAGVGLAGLVLGAIVGLAVVLAFRHWAPTQRALALGVSQAALWTGMLGAVVLVSRRYGSGSIRQDYGFRVRLADLGWGTLLALVARALTLAIAVVVVLVARRHIGGGGVASGGGAAAHDTNLLILLCLVLVVGAPLVEELFFRGLMLRSLQVRVWTPVAVVAQAVLFSACHVLTATGIGLVTELLSTLMFGLFAGAVVVRFRRLGPTMIAHALFNLVAAVVLIVMVT